MLNWLNKKLAILSISLSNVEKNALSQTGEMLGTNINTVTRLNQGKISDSLINGEVTEEVENLRWRTYKILRAAEGTKTSIIGYDEDGMPITKTIKVNNKNFVKKIAQDPFDYYPLEMVIDNTEISLSGNEAMDNDYIELYNDAVINYDEEGNEISASHGSINSTEYSISNKSELPIKIGRDNVPNFMIENFTKKLHVRKINETEKLLEFFISVYPDEYFRTSRLFISEIKKIIENNKKSTITNINSVNFITYKSIGINDYLEFEYNNILFDKISEFKGYYIIKFKASVVKNGVDIFETYKIDSLDKKYENKEKK